MLFNSDFLKRLEYLSLLSRRVFHGRLLAQRRTTRTGQGIEFSDHREYTRGDDLRYLDWNIYARHGDLLIRRFQEEQDLIVCLILDCSRSMSIGNPAKFDLARQLAASLAYIALSDQDRVCILACADDVVAEFPLTRSQSKIIPMMNFLRNLTTTGKDTDISTAVRKIAHRGRRRLAVVISDLFDRNGFERALNELRYRHIDAHVVQLHDVGEASPNLIGDVELVDVETGKIRSVTITEAQLKTYRARFQEHQHAVSDYCRRYSIRCTQSPTSVRFDELMIRMMREADLAGKTSSREGTENAIEGLPG
jgi:uncharacterized protein (DUF58 family)